MKHLTLITWIVLLIVPPVQSDLRPSGLPAGAKIIEVQPIPSSAHPDRALILWMLNPTRHPLEYAPEDPYTCPDRTRGSYYHGPTRVSLLNTQNHRIINTVKIRDEEEDAFEIPYRI